MKRRAVLVLCLALSASPLPAAQPQFHRLEGAADFLEGDLQGLSVDSDGRVRLAPATKLLHDTEAPFVWCLVTDAKGVVFAGTGNDGRVFRIEAGKATLLFDAPELEVHALAVGPDGRLYVGTSPDGRVYAVDLAGQSTTFFDPSEKYIWALAFDPAGSLLVATGAEGRVYRVDAKGASTTLLQTAETHVLSLAVDPKGTLYAGSAPSGILYRVDGAGKVFVVNDSTYREVKALDLGKDGSVYAALVDGRPAAPEEAPRAGAGAVSPATPTASVEVTVTEAFTGMPLSGATGSSAPVATPGGPAKGALVRVGPGGEIDTLWSSSEDTPQGILASADGTLLATGGKGRLFRVRDDRSYTLVGILPSEQVTALARRGEAGTIVAVSGPGKVLSLEEGPGERGTFVSKPRDTETVSTWGRLRVEAAVPLGTDLQVQTRAGNTETPDATWSDWSVAYKDRDGQAITSERARFLQIRATLVGKDGKTPTLDSMQAAFLQRNLRPQVPQVTVHPPGEVFQKPITVSADPEVLGLDALPPVTPTAAGSTKAGSGMPGPTAFSRKMYQRGLQTFSWRGEDQNGDTLAYDVYFRATSETRFRLLRKGLTEAVLAWDTSTVPNGRYLVRVVASDAPSNPGGLALTGARESAAFDVDNTPPALGAQLMATTPGRIRATAKDEASPLRRAEYSVDGGRWEEIYPVDGINDGREEAYEFAPEGLVGAGPHVIVVRAIDLLGNGASVRVELP